MKRKPRPGERNPLRELYEQHGAHEPQRLHEPDTHPAMTSDAPTLTTPDQLEHSSEFQVLGDSTLFHGNPDLVLTGRKRSGKSYLAQAIGHEPLGFADPMEEVCLQVLGHNNREDPDVRKFLINLGALGRGVQVEELPHELRNSIDWRALGRRLQRDGASVTGIGDSFLWESFGLSNFWIDVMEARVEARDPATPVAIHNARFPNEVERFTSRGFQHVHVMASEERRRARLQANGEEPDPDADTEQLARELDAVAGEGRAPRVRGGLARQLPAHVVDAVAVGGSVVWSDPRNEPDLEAAFDATADEPDPQGEGQDVAELVHEDLEARVSQGEEEYGERLTTHNGRDAIVDAYQEVLDTALYLRQEIEERT